MICRARANCPPPAPPIPYAQQSQVLSVDADYDGLQRLTLGGKYAFRCGQPRDGRDLSAPWFHRVDPEATQSNSVGLARSIRSLKLLNLLRYFGEPGQDRTDDHMIKSHVLYH